MFSLDKIWRKKFEYAELYVYRTQTVFSNWTTQEPPILYSEINVANIEDANVKLSALIGVLSDEGWRIADVLHRQPKNDADWYVFFRLQRENMEVDLERVTALLQDEMEKLARDG